MIKVFIKTMLSNANNTFIGKMMPTKFKDRFYKILFGENNEIVHIDQNVFPNEPQCEDVLNDNGVDDKEYRPCHFKQLFIKSTGEVFPCCRVWPRTEMIIGHILDSDLLHKIRNYDPPQCSCKRYSLRKNNFNDEMRYFNLNLELSLVCQAKCVMCCVNSPGWSEPYSYYSDITKLIDAIGRVDKIVFQGGEILVQSESLSYIKNLKEKMPPSTEFTVITNGNVSIEMVDKMEKIFDRIMISIVGFQPETYRKVMGIEFNKTINFAETLINRNNVKVILKYLLTPINYHEQNLFLNWALNLVPSEVVICDSGWRSYVNENTPDDYWRKIMDRTKDSVIKELVNCDVDKLRNNSTTIFIENIAHYGIDADFLKQNHLDLIVKEYDT